VPRSVKVTVAGHTLSLRTDAKSRYLKDLATYVSDKIDEAKQTGKVATTQSLTLLAAMNIADELFQLREDKARLEREVRERTERILRHLDAEEQASSP